MEGQARTWFTPKQRAELWERWKSGQCVADIASASEPSRRCTGREPPRLKLMPAMALFLLQEKSN